jgi:PKD repeat protein
MNRVILIIINFLIIFSVAKAQQVPANVQSYLSNNFSKSGLIESDVKDVTISSQYTDRASERTYIYLQQAWKGIPVFNAIAPVVVSNGKVYGSKIPFVNNLSSKINSVTPAITPQQAISAALTHLKMEASVPVPVMKNGEARKFTADIPSLLSSPVEVELMYVETKKGVKLVWNISLDLKDGSHYWNIRIDATTGEFLEKNDWVVSCNFNVPHDHSVHSASSYVMSPNPLPMPGSGTAKYNVFPLPIESPIHGTLQLLNDPSEPVASPYGWHDTNGALGTEYNITRGNNVYAYEDANSDNLPGYSPDGGASQIFNFPYHPDSSNAYQRNASLTNLFYMSNVIHDILHQNGFNEAAGNFQQNNYGNGGAANDYVNAEGFDGSGTNNANFATPPDGSNPRMQMYLWTNPTVCNNSLTINAPTAIAGLKPVGVASYNPASAFNITANVVLAQDGVGTSSDGCSAFTNAAAISGKIALIDRGTCSFVIKTQFAQAAGAIGVIIANNATGTTPPAMTGTPTTTITIPSVSVTQSDGNAMKTQLNSAVTVNAKIIICTAPPQLDGSFDNGIVAHEYGHGVSNRLTGGPAAASCLTNEEQGGEGWSDWLGLILTIEQGDQGVNPRGIGTYALGQSTNGVGIRRYPYSTNMSINPLTYADISTSVYPHGRGEIWCAAIWDMTWFLIRDYGYNANLYTGTSGNNIAMKLVLEGMKLQPCSPGYIDARDAILLADDILYSGAHRCQIWEAFARRGMGYLATQGSSNAVGDEVVDFTYPPFCNDPTAPPIANFNATQTTALCPGSVKFNDLSTDIPQSWLWNFGDGTTSTQQNPTHVYAQPGLYSVKLVVTNTLGNDSLLLSNYITITSFNVSVTATPDTICSGDTLQLTTTITNSNAISGYNLSTITYAPITGSGTSISLTDEAVSTARPIGFTFNFYGNLYTNFYVSSNGFIGFNANMANGCCTGSLIPSVGSPDNLIAFAWNDLNPGANSSVVSYFTTGTAPNRKLIVRYNTYHYNGTAYPMRGQIILYEGSNVIEIHSEVITAVPGEVTTQGIENNNGSAGVVPTGRNAAVFGITNNAVRFTPFTNFTYSWTPTTAINNSSIASPLVWPTNSQSYQVTAVDANGCGVTQSTAVVVNLCIDQSVLNLHAFIEGFMNSSGRMEPILYNNELHNSPTACDSIIVELHSTISPYNTVYSTTALLDIDGNASASFPAIAAGNSYYISIRTRNGLETWSKQPVLMGENVNYDFVTP